MRASRAAPWPNGRNAWVGATCRSRPFITSTRWSPTRRRATLASSCRSTAPTPAKLPARLHHTAYVSSNLERTRVFYEDLLGFPLMATWCESDELFGAIRTYCHLFFGLADGSALAFFQFVKPEDQQLFGPKMP